MFAHSDAPVPFGDQFGRLFADGILDQPFVTSGQVVEREVTAFRGGPQGIAPEVVELRSAGMLKAFRVESVDQFTVHCAEDAGLERGRNQDLAVSRCQNCRVGVVTLESVEIGNKIEIVQVGDRYDMQRHNAKERGVEVSDVYGWIVLRDNGKVYSKANVSVQ